MMNPTYSTFSGFRKLLAAEVRAARGVRIKAFILLYRLASYGAAGGALARLVTLPIYVLYRLYGEFLLGMELPIKVVAGPGLAIFHGHGLVVHPEARIGARCTLRQGVTIGNKMGRDGRQTAAPRIGDDVEFGAGSVVIGNVRVGSRVAIGACTVVTRSVPDDTIVVGQSMRVIHRKEAA